MKLKIAIFSLLLLLCGLLTRAQDENFSNYRFAALVQNPAESGRIETDMQLSLLYRTQWNTVFEGGFRSGYAGFEWQLFCPRDNFFAMGVASAYERAGDSNFERANGSLAFAYHHQVSSRIFLAAGGELGLLSYRLDAGDLRFDEQFDGFGFDPSLPNFESFAGASTIEADAAIGALLYEQEGDWSVGFSIDHLNAPTVSLLEEETFNVALGSTIYGNVRIPLPGNSLNAHLMYKNFGLVNNKQGFLLGGLDLLIPLSSPRKVRLPHYFDADISLRIAGSETSSVVSDAIILSGRYAFQGWQVGFSYDINISPLATATNTFGALEAYLAIPIVKDKACVRCPRMGGGWYDR